MGKEGIGLMNEIGELFTEFCGLNEMVHRRDYILSSPHPQSHLDIA